MTKQLCRHCKKNEGTICDSQNKKYGKKYYTCRDCNSKRARKYRETESGKTVYREIMRRQYVKNHDKVIARVLLNQALKIGKVVKPKKCEDCQKRKKLEGHHEDYNKPLVVKWVCRDCHVKIP